MRRPPPLRPALLLLLLVPATGCPRRVAMRPETSTSTASSSVASPSTSTSTASSTPTPRPSPLAPSLSRGDPLDADATPTSPPTPAPAGPGAPLAPERLAALRAGADAVLRAQAERYWRLFTVGESADPAAAWSAHEALRSASTLAALADAQATAPGEARRGLANLRAWLTGERLARESLEATRRVTTLRAEAVFGWDGRVVPLREARGLLAGEHERERRRALAAAAAQAARPVAEADAARARALGDAAAALGFREPLALAATVRGADPAALAALAEATLSRTEGLWRAVVADLARAEGLAGDAVASCDLPRLLRAVAPPSAFGEDRQLEAGAEVLSGLGIDLAAQPALRVDAAARPRKLPLAIALPVDPPRDVRLSTAPVGGVEALRGFLHELGVAQAYLHVRAGPPELRRLGSAAVTGAWGITFEELAGTPAWLESRGVPREAAAGEARASAGRRLWRAREAAGRVLVEVARAGGADEAALRGIAERAVGFPLSPPEVPWTWDRDPLLRSADALRAELLAAQVEQFLAAKAGGEAWWRSRPAGAWLAAVWAEGGARAPEDLSLAMERGGLDPAALVEVAAARAGR